MPEISVVIPTRGPESELGRVLDRLEHQSCGPAAFEVLVCLDSADDHDQAAIQSIVGSRPYPARVLRSQTRGASAARNTGLAAAEAELVLFLGDDVLAEPQLFAEHLAWHARHPEPEIGVL